MLKNDPGRKIAPKDGQEKSKPEFFFLIIYPPKKSPLFVFFNHQASPHPLGSAPKLSFFPCLFLAPKAQIFFGGECRWSRPICPPPTKNDFGQNSTTSTIQKKNTPEMVVSDEEEHLEQSLTTL